MQDGLVAMDRAHWTFVLWVSRVREMGGGLNFKISQGKVLLILVTVCAKAMNTQVKKHTLSGSSKLTKSCL